MGKSERRKGNRVEREIVRMLNGAGIPARRVPLSGACEGFEGDIVIGDGYKAEVKARKSGEGFKQIDAWLGAKDFLFLKRDRGTPTVVMPWEMFVELARAEKLAREGGEG